MSYLSPSCPMDYLRRGGLTQSTINPGATGYSYTVEAASEAQARSAGRLAMIADGRAPASILHVDRDPDGSGRFEVVITDRPLKAGEVFLPDGTRAGNAGTRSDRWHNWDEWSLGR